MSGNMIKKTCATCNPNNINNPIKPESFTLFLNASCPSIVLKFFITGIKYAITPIIMTVEEIKRRINLIKLFS